MRLFRETSTAKPARRPRLAGILGLLSCWLLLAGPARATHIVGGELVLTHTTGTAYTLVLNLYFDAFNGDPSLIDANLTASFFDKATNSRVLNLPIPLVSNSLVNYTNPACTKPNLITRKLIYSKEVTLDPASFAAPQGYYVAVERCCRNVSIANIVNPGNAAQTFYLEFPAVERNGQPFYDSTPQLFPALADYACLNELFSYDFAGRDADGDSLVYELATPLNGHASISMPKPTAAPLPYLPISWNPGLSATNPIPGSPTLRIGQLTGRLTVRPTNIGLFVFGVRCSEYRRGEKIGEVRRDFQLLVLTCPPNRSPSLRVLRAATGTGAYQPGRDTLRFVPGGNHCVRVRFTDPDPGSRLTLALRPVNFSGLLPVLGGTTSGVVRTPGAPDTLTATLCFPACLDSQRRLWLLDVVVADDGCSLPRRDTVRLAFTAVAPPNSPPGISTTAPAARPLVAPVGSVVSFEVTGTDPDRDSVQLEMTGRGFVPTDLGATLTPVAGSNPPRARFRWPVDCRALVGDSVRVFQFAAVTNPCVGRQTAAVDIPMVVRYANRAPGLVSVPALPVGSGPGNPPLVRLPLGAIYTLTLTGTDPDLDGLTLTASSESFSLAEAGMNFSASSGTGTATGTFTWTANCAAVNLHRPLNVTFQLLDATCRPLPQRLTVQFEVARPTAPELKLYNIITPNGDKQNDEFRLPELPANFCDEQFERVQIYSRWGQLVFESGDREFRWPGEGQATTYYYLVSYTDGRRFKGWLEVLP